MLLVEVTNITDAPGKQARQVDLYKKTLSPGDSVKVPAELITPQVRSLEKEGLIHIGQVPSWYTAYKMKHGKQLTPEQVKQRLVKAKPVAKSAPAKDKKKKSLFLEETVPTEVIVSKDIVKVGK